MSQSPSQLSRGLTGSFCWFSWFGWFCLVLVDTG
jgi:hypothetical protein